MTVLAETGAGVALALSFALLCQRRLAGVLVVLALQVVTVAAVAAGQRAWPLALVEVVWGAVGLPWLLSRAAAAGQRAGMGASSLVSQAGTTKEVAHRGGVGGGPVAQLARMGEPKGEFARAGEPIALLAGAVLAAVALPLGIVGPGLAVALLGVLFVTTRPGIRMSLAGLASLQSGAALAGLACGGGTALLAAPVLPAVLLGWAWQRRGASSGAADDARPSWPERASDVTPSWPPRTGHDRLSPWPEEAGPDGRPAPVPASETGLTREVASTGEIALARAITQAREMTQARETASAGKAHPARETALTGEAAPAGELASTGEAAPAGEMASTGEAAPAGEMTSTGKAAPARDTAAPRETAIPRNTDPAREMASTGEPAASKHAAVTGDTRSEGRPWLVATPAISALPWLPEADFAGCVLLALLAGTLPWIGVPSGPWRLDGLMMLAAILVSLVLVLLRWPTSSRGAPFSGCVTTLGALLAVLPEPPALAWFGLAIAATGAVAAAPPRYCRLAGIGLGFALFGSLTLNATPLPAVATLLLGLACLGGAAPELAALALLLVLRLDGAIPDAAALNGVRFAPGLDSILLAAGLLALLVAVAGLASAKPDRRLPTLATLGQAGVAIVALGIDTPDARFGAALQILLLVLARLALDLAAEGGLARWLALASLAGLPGLFPSLALILVAAAGHAPVLLLPLGAGLAALGWLLLRRLPAGPYRVRPDLAWLPLAALLLLGFGMPGPLGAGLHLLAEHLQ